MTSGADGRMPAVAVTIRRARSEEADDLAVAYEWLHAPPGAWPPDWDRAAAAARLQRVIAAESVLVLVGEADGELAGICTAYEDIESVRFGRRIWVEDLAVHPERRSLGVGKRLLDAAKAWGRERGATHLELDTAEGRVDAHRLYEREGARGRTFCYAWEL